MASRGVWLITTRDDGFDWYPCGFELHRTKSAAELEGAKFKANGCPGPFRARRYVPADEGGKKGAKKR